MFCDECFEASIHICDEDIILRAGLTANTEYYWLIQDRHGNLTQRKVSTDAEGQLTLDIDTLPQINKYSGIMKLQLRQGADYLQPVNMTFGPDTFSCVLISLDEIDRVDSDESEVNVITYKVPA